MQVRGVGYLYQPTYKRHGVRLKSNVYWWKHRGRRVSTGCRTEADAQRWVIERLLEMRQGHLVGAVNRPLRYDDLERLLLERWELDGRRAIPQSMCRLKRLRRAFSSFRVEEITPSAIQTYTLERHREGAAPATINLELAILHRGMVLAHEAGRLNYVPRFRRLPGVGHRTGTVEAGDFEAILARIPARYVPILRFLYWTGWRRAEALTLTWSHVDLAAKEFRLVAENSKTGEPRIFSYAAVPELERLIEGQRASPVLSPYVFQGRGGAPMDPSALGKAWRIACRSAGVPNALIHDLRRTMTRDLRRADVSLAVAMRTVGHASLTVHQGYSVVSQADQDEGLARVAALRAGEPLQRRFAKIMEC